MPPSARRRRPLLKQTSLPADIVPEGGIQQRSVTGASGSHIGRRREGADRARLGRSRAVAGVVQPLAAWSWKHARSISASAHRSTTPRATRSKRAGRTKASTWSPRPALKLCSNLIDILSERGRALLAESHPAAGQPSHCRRRPGRGAERDADCRERRRRCLDDRRFGLLENPRPGGLKTALRVRIRTSQAAPFPMAPMADSGPESISSSAPGDSSRTRRAHTYSRLTTAIAVLALAIAGYSLVRLDTIRDKLDTANAAVAASNADRELLRAELKSQASRERQAHRDLNRRLDTFNDAPQAVTGTGLLGRGTSRSRRRARARLVACRSFVSSRAGTAPADPGSRCRDCNRRAGVGRSAPGLAARYVVRRCSSGNRQGAASAARRAAAGHHRHSVPPDQCRRARQRRPGQGHSGHRAQRLRSQQVAGWNVCSRRRHPQPDLLESDRRAQSRRHVRQRHHRRRSTAEDVSICSCCSSRPARR